MTVNPPAIPPNGRHRYRLRAYYEDTDPGGIVYHARYLGFAERGRTEAMREMGIAHAEMVERFAVMFVVRHVAIDYLRPARLDDSLVVETSALEVGGASVVMRQDIIGPEGLCVGITLRLGCVRRDDGRPARLPARWREVMAALRDAALGNPAS